MKTIPLKRVAIFVDAENVTHWLKQDVVKALIAELLLLGQLIIRKAYGVLSRSQLTIHQATLNQQGFEIIHCYHPVSRKHGRHSNDGRRDRKRLAITQYRYVCIGNLRFRFQSCVQTT